VNYSPATEVVATSRHLSADVGGDVMVLELDEGVYFGIEGAGQLIWHLVQNPRSIGEVVDRVVDEFDVSRDTAQADVVAFIDSLRVNGLLEVREPDDAAK
jgi:hypothetical protein